MASGVRTAVQRIVVVEDDDDLREMLIEALTMAGHSVRGARDGVEALEFAVPGAIDCVLLDIGLPRLGGVEVARRLRERGFVGAIVAVSGYVREEDRDEARAAGCDAYLVKPVDLPVLQRTIVACTHRAARVR